MKNVKRSMGMLFAVLGFVVAPVVLADSPVKLDQPDAHSVEVKGKVSLYRVQVKGMNFGEGQESTQAEVIVTLDSKPGMIYTLSLYDPDSNTPSAVNKEMAETLRTAYVSKSPVTLYHQISMKKKNNFRIIMVQLD
ncbi:hypothetical protein [Kaarinaea lacus]